MYDRNHHFSLGLIPKPKPKLANTIGRYRNQYRNHISKGETVFNFQLLELHIPLWKGKKMKKKVSVLEKKVSAQKPIPKMYIGFDSRYHKLVSVAHYFIYDFSPLSTTLKSWFACAFLLSHVVGFFSGNSRFPAPLYCIIENILQQACRKQGGQEGTPDFAGIGKRT